MCANISYIAHTALSKTRLQRYWNAWFSACILFCWIAAKASVVYIPFNISLPLTVLICVHPFYSESISHITFQAMILRSRHIVGKARTTIICNAALEKRISKYFVLIQNDLKKKIRILVSNETERNMIKHFMSRKSTSLRKVTHLHI